MNKPTFRIDIITPTNKIHKTCSLDEFRMFHSQLWNSCGHLLQNDYDVFEYKSFETNTFYRVERLLTV